MPTQLSLFVGQTAANGTLTWSEPGAAGVPSDAALVSDNPGVCPITLNPDGTWTAGPAVAPGVANINATGTSAPPDVGPIVADPMVVTVSTRPAAETVVFNPTTATVS